MKRRLKSRAAFFRDTDAISTVAKGAAGELLVAIDLIARGLRVYRSITPDGPCDLLAMNDEGEVARIEVRSGSQRSDGYVNFGRRQSDLCDIYAVCMGDREVVYFDVSLANVTIRDRLATVLGRARSWNGSRSGKMPDRRTRVFYDQCYRAVNGRRSS